MNQIFATRNDLNAVISSHRDSIVSQLESAGFAVEIPTVNGQRDHATFRATLPNEPGVTVSGKVDYNGYRHLYGSNRITVGSFFVQLQRGTYVGSYGAPNRHDRRRFPFSAKGWNFKGIEGWVSNAIISERAYRRRRAEAESNAAASKAVLDAALASAGFGKLGEIAEPGSVNPAVKFDLDHNDVTFNLSLRSYVSGRGPGGYQSAPGFTVEQAAQLLTALTQAGHGEVKLAALNIEKVAPATAAFVVHVLANPAFASSHLIVK